MKIKTHTSQTPSRWQNNKDKKTYYVISADEDGIVATRAFKDVIGMQATDIWFSPEADFLESFTELK